MTVQDDYSSRTRSRVVALVVVAVLGVALGFWLGRTSSPKGKDASPAPSSVAPTTSGGRSVVNGVPVGYPRTELGAVEAATNFGRVMASVSSDEKAYVDAMRTLAAPEWVPEAEELAAAGFRFLKERYGSEGSFTFVPVRYRVASYSNERSVVELWGVTVSSGPKVAGIEETWLTGTVELTWVSDDWRVAGQDSVTGPTPELLQTEDALTADALSEFKEYEHAPAP